MLCYVEYNIHEDNMNTQTKSIIIPIETYERLFRRKEHPKESMNSVIQRLLDANKEKR